MKLQPDDICVLVGITGECQRFNGELVRLVALEPNPFGVGTKMCWRVDPLFPLPLNICPLCHEEYLRRIDPEGRELMRWDQCEWSPNRSLVEA